MAKYRKRPVVIEAVQWIGENYDEVKEFAGDAFVCWHIHYDSISINTREGVTLANKGDWIIRDGGEVYPCKQGLFDAMYEFYGSFCELVEEE